MSECTENCCSCSLDLNNDPNHHCLCREKITDDNQTIKKKENDDSLSICSNSSYYSVESSTILSTEEKPEEDINLVSFLQIIQSSSPSCSSSDLRLTRAMELKNGKDNNCDLCKMKAVHISVSFYCRYCDKCFCESCVVYHEKLSSPSHQGQLINLSKPTELSIKDLVPIPMCDDHRLPVTLYCQECQACLCVACWERHKENGPNKQEEEEEENEKKKFSSPCLSPVVATLDSVEAEKRDEAKILFEELVSFEENATKESELIEIVMSELSKNTERKCESLREELEALLTSLHHQLAVLISQIQYETLWEENKLEEKLNSWKSYLLEVESLKTRLGNLLEFGNVTHLLLAMKEIRAQKEKLDFSDFIATMKRTCSISVDVEYSKDYLKFYRNVSNLILGKTHVTHKAFDKINISCGDSSSTLTRVDSSSSSSNKSGSNNGQTFFNRLSLTRSKSDIGIQCDLISDKNKVLDLNDFKEEGGGGKEEGRGEGGGREEEGGREEGGEEEQGGARGEEEGGKGEEERGEEEEGGKDEEGGEEEERGGEERGGGGEEEKEEMIEIEKKPNLLPENLQSLPSLTLALPNKNLLKLNPSQNFSSCPPNLCTEENNSCLGSNDSFKTNSIDFSDASSVRSDFSGLNNETTTGATGNPFFPCADMNNFDLAERTLVEFYNKAEYLSDQIPVLKPLKQWPLILEKNTYVRGLTIDKDDHHIFVCDRSSKKITQFNPDGKLMCRCDVSGTGIPWDVSSISSSALFVTMPQQNKLLMLRRCSGKSLLAISLSLSTSPKRYMSLTNVTSGILACDQECNVNLLDFSGNEIISVVSSREQLPDNLVSHRICSGELEDSFWVLNITSKTIAFYRVDGELLIYHRISFKESTSDICSDCYDCVYGCDKKRIYALTSKGGENILWTFKQELKTHPRMCVNSDRDKLFVSYQTANKNILQIFTIRPKFMPID